MNHRTYQLLRKGWEVIGHTFDGAAYCLDHTPNDITRLGDMPAPIFSSDDHGGMWCDECGKVID